MQGGNRCLINGLFTCTAMTMAARPPTHGRWGSAGAEGRLQSKCGTNSTTHTAVDGREKMRPNA